MDVKEDATGKEDYPVNIDESKNVDEKDAHPMTTNIHGETVLGSTPSTELHKNMPTTNNNKNVVNGNDINIIVNYKQLINLMCNNMLCRLCKSKMISDCFHKSSYGIATTVEVMCTSCHHRSFLKTPRNKPERLENIKKDKDCSKIMVSPKRNSTYTLNVRLVLFLQHFGISATVARQLASGLGLSSGSWTFSKYTALEEEIGLHQIKLGEEILDENIRKEMDESPVGVNGRKHMGTLMDTG